MNAPLPTLLTEHKQGSNWQASLALRVERRGARSALTHNLHQGPLRVQKALHPEGDDVCQVLILHPPAGIAGGDELRIDLKVAHGAHAQVTTPGAGKWYRSLGPTATQRVHLDIAENAVLEWLPQEVIVFDRAIADTETIVTLALGAKAIGWDLVCLGRTASGERFKQGSYRQRFRLQRPDGSPLWRETMHLQGSDAAMSSKLGLAHHTVFGTLWLAGIKPDAALLEALRGLSIAQGTCGVSALPDVTAVRLVSNSSEAARRYFEAVWALARQHILQRAPMPPRIWRT
ncbi:MAG TPA: urease accessory protein UreD [Rhodocyclaceae bacterium]|nr:urease accessory protein UreD [Rhodocyclaceae bacterium]